ncbi:uncharacterized protein LOC129755541 [Uranotaenia lowii]|uniref:uncharacterized protein LOC129755541 n=1 Tax=Uranotaenia lowii TaxID=190385 RepID=UPI0024794170|nr:uncharacterized protein LOC129755541 [Uranotaenia lowii]
MPQSKSHLATLIKGRGSNGFSEYEVLKIFCDVCESLAPLHCSQAPIIYRDIRVENVVQNDMGRFMLVESGTATSRLLNPVAHGKKLVEEEVQKNTTMPYRAPEMVDLNSGHSITTKVDIWALGCLLYKLCFGTMPFGESSKAILHCQFNIPEKNKYSPELCQLIRILLEPDPEKRPSIYQVCEHAFKVAGKDNPLRIALERQKSQPNVHAVAPVVTNISDQQERKVQHPTISGTSVAPRSRPKVHSQPTNTGGSSSNSFNLGPPPLNPSPKNVISPIPATAITGNDHHNESRCTFVAHFGEKFSTSNETKSGTLAKSPATGLTQSRGSIDSSFRFYAGDGNKLLVPPPDLPLSKDKSMAASPSSLLSPFETEPSTTVSSSTRARPTSLLPSLSSKKTTSSTSQPRLQHHHYQQPTTTTLSNSNSEKSLVSPTVSTTSSTWNPFGDASPFSPNSTLIEDQLFGAEFDKLRLEDGSQTSILTSPEEIRSERASLTSAGRMPPAEWFQQSHNQRHSLPTSLTGAASTGALVTAGLSHPDMIPEEDPFGSAPFTLPKRLKDKAGRSSKLTSKLSEVISNATAGGNLWRNSSGTGGKESLIVTTPGGPPSGDNGTIGNGDMLGIKLDDLISAGEKGSPNFIKLPLDDRNKYEKLNSNDVTSDDSDAEFYTDSVGGVKKQSFKQFVENNIPEKLQAVYHKVDKSQIKNVQIVRKLRGKVVHKDDVKKRHQKGASGAKENRVRETVADQARKGNDDSDDSIGSASDLRANEDFIDGEEVDNGKAVVGRIPKKFNRGAFGEGSVDDCISESIKTCGSSAYHAECESVTTNEDNSSRIVTRVRIKKREHDSKHSVIDEDDSGEEDMIQGDKPLLLDDELDYESAPENNISSEEALMDPFTPESLPDESEQQPEEDEVVLDPFAMAPFRKPIVPRRNSIKYTPNIHPIPENCPTIPAPPLPPQVDDFSTSTPIKPKHNRSQTELFHLSPTTAAPPANPAPIAEVAPMRIEAPQTSSSTQPTARTDLFGSEPFPALILSPPIATVSKFSSEIPTVSVEPGSVALTQIIPATNVPPEPQLPNTNSANVPLHQPPASMTARLNYINFSQVNATQQSITPDNNYVNFHEDYDHDDDDARKLKSDEYDDSSDTVVVKTPSKGGFLSKKEKVKYNSLKGKSSANDGTMVSVGGATSSGNHVLVIPAKLSQKVKVNVPGYRKVSGKTTKKDKSNGGTSSAIDRYQDISRQQNLPPGSAKSKSGNKVGLCNMSFEDFPSDEALEEPIPSTVRGSGSKGTSGGSSGVGRLMKIAPFEVIRNDKMLLEAEKKFGSLKRRSNPFS